MDYEDKPPLGFIAIEVQIHRPPGDPYNEQTWPFPLIHEKAQGSTEKEVVSKEGYNAAFIDRFVEAGLKLAARGAIGIITSCGFLAMAQPELASRLPIPIATSALLQIPSILSLLPANKSIAVITYDDARLSPSHLERLGIASAVHHRIHIRGAPAYGYLRRLIQDGAAYSHEGIEAELVQVFKEMAAKHGDVGAVVLECTQMPPFAEAIQRAVGPGVPIYDVYTLGCWFYSGLLRRRPVAWGKL